MAASYSTGTVATPTALLQALVTWLVAQGWTSDSSVSYGAGWRAHLHKNGQYVNLRALVNEAGNIATAWGTGGATTTAGYGIAMYLGDGYNGSNAWNAQSGGPLENAGVYRVGVGVYLTSAAIPAYHFLDDGNDHITVVVDKGNGLTGYLGWGPSLVKTGYTSDYWYFYGSSPGYYCVSYGTGGPYPGVGIPAHAPMVAVYSEVNYSSSLLACSFVRVDASVFAARWCGMTDQTLYGQAGGYTGKLISGWCGRLSGSTENGNTAHGTVHAMFYQRSWQTAFAGALLLPIHVFMLNTIALWNALGYPPTVFLFNGVGHGFTSGSVINIGGINYLAFANFAVKKLA